jgi:xanthine dehydrogenase YagR molybdenum-binding subunit
MSTTTPAIGTTTAIGQGIDRVDGPLKVTGGAKYSAEIALPDMAYAAFVGASVSSARVTAIDTSAADRLDGVIAVLTHHDLPKVTQPPLLPSLFGIAAPGETFFPMQDDIVHYGGQPVAIVVADSYEQAQYAATLVKVTYERKPSVTTIDEGRADAYEPHTIFAGFVPGHTSRGDVDSALAKAEHTVQEEYRFAANHHNPIETSSTTAMWDGDQLTLYDSSQGITATQATVSALLNMSPSHVRVIAHFVGGSFGCKAMVWPHSTLTAMAAKHVGRPVKLAVTRGQMFSTCGHREEQEQGMVLGATSDGHLTAVRHHKISVTSPFDDWAEPAFGASSQLYTCANYEGSYQLVRGNTMTPTFTRGPGEGIGIFVVECTMDQLAHDLGIDPVDLRMRNISDVDPGTGNPWSSHGLRECLQAAAARFGWADHNPVPRSRREGNMLIGTGMAAVGYVHPLFNHTQRARARIYSDGSAVVQTATQEFGTGTATAMTQVAAEGLGVRLADMRCEVGDTNLPNASACVGSAGAGMISAAIYTASTALRDQLIAMAVEDPKSPLHEADPGTVMVRDGRMILQDMPDAGETYADLLHRHFLSDVEAIGAWDPPPLDTPHGMLTFGAQFAEVAVDADLGLVRVRRMAGAFAPGRVLNPKLARSQLMGGMLWGLGQAILEGTRMDPRDGRWANASLGDYLVAVNADAPDVDVDLIEVRDDVVNPLGVKGVGEIGQVGVAAAIANAVFNATGYRPTQLPIAPEHLLDALSSTSTTTAT